MRYRRAFVPGAVYFFTLVTDKRRPILASEAAVETLRAAFRVVKAKRPFEINAMVVLPDHLHCIWTLPPNDADFATRWRLIKTWFSKHCDPALRGINNASQQKRHEQAIWQHRFWEHLIRDENDFARHVDYIHYNPVKHGYATRAADWVYSSFARFVASGDYTADWGQGELKFEGVGHE